MRQGFLLLEQPAEGFAGRVVRGFAIHELLLGGLLDQV